MKSFVCILAIAASFSSLASAAQNCFSQQEIINGLARAGAVTPEQFGNNIDDLWPVAVAPASYSAIATEFQSCFQLDMNKYNNTVLTKDFVLQDVESQCGCR